MASFNRQTTTPRQVSKSRRNQPINHLSSLMPGKAHPVAFIPMLREDQCTGRVQFVVEMMETKEILANGVKARFSAYVVPWLAMERFQGSRDQFDRSWMGKPKTDDPGETVTPFFTTQVYGAVSEMALFKAAGLHYGPTDAVNTMYVESYNRIYNWRARDRSKDLTPRELDDTSLAPAFWHHTGFEHVVHDFDEAVLHGEVALSVVEAHLPLSLAKANVRMDGVDGNHVGINNGAARINSGAGVTEFKLAAPSGGKSLYADLTGVMAEMEGNGITVSLANLKRAAKLQSFAQVRRRFEGHDDDDIIDMLMAGLTIEDQWLKDPILLDEEVATFRQAKRYATTAGELDDSAVSGVASATLSVRVPRLAVGGVIVVLCEILPDQLFERRADPFLFIDDKDDLPDAQLDSLDMIRVDVVTNRMVDIAHSNPGDTFGYEPKHARWNTRGPGVGGDFLRPTANTAFDEARQRIWAVEAIDPVLTDDFYIAKDGIHIKPFLNDEMDPFQIQARGNLVMTGLTQFGGVLIEATGNYDKLAEIAGDIEEVKP